LNELPQDSGAHGVEGLGDLPQLIKCDRRTAEALPEVELTFDDNNFEILKRLDEDMRDHFDQSANYSSSRSLDEEKLKAYAEASICSRETLFEHLMKQARESFDSPEQLEMAEVLIGNFDASGFLGTALSEIALVSCFKEKQLQSVLKKIQRFDPYGVGARSLQESLLIQLRSLGKKGTLAYQLVSENYDELLHNRLPQIQKAQGCTLDGIAKAIKEDICKLDLHPGASFSDAPVQLLVSDVAILIEGEKLVVKVNEESIPSLRLNRRYMRYLEDPAVPVETKEFIKQKIVSAKWFLRNISQRNDTLEKIALSLIKHQFDFFMNPDGKLQPMIMQAMAEELNVHESTIARAVSNKYVDSPRGMLPLRSFFTNGYVTESGKDISSTTVRDALIDIVAAEDKLHPLSDEAISVHLKARGIICARRTIAKYRAMLNLGSAHQRRKFS
jgi:RNA polymerase sigma-54 factor